MRQEHDRISIETSGPGLHEVTALIEGFARRINANSGLLTIYIEHTSASLTIQENADPDVLRDLQDFFSRIAPRSNTAYRHNAEGPDDMPAHIRAALTLTQVGIPVRDGCLALGTWQGVYLFEHRDAAHRRRISLHFIGD